MNDLDIFLHIVNKSIPELKNIISISVTRNYEYSTKMGLMRVEEELIITLPNIKVECIIELMRILDFCGIIIKRQEFTFETAVFTAFIK